jgi:energy-coupling factor transporter ATP-binding protein EcfA2
VALVNALRGSGIHYNQIAPSLARELTPLELVTAAERLDPDAITAATDIPRDRAIALLSYLRNSSVADVIAAEIEDGVTLSLLDGLEYKQSDQLSIGQRCTAVLPILLAQHSGPLIVDQPEDNLDNAFITSTLVERLRTRDPGTQLIFASHNPNIPVLGEADQIIVMGSDGRRGYKLHQGALEDPHSVQFITSLLEGGSDAFRRRAEFYSRLDD